MCGRVRCTLRADDVCRACYLKPNHVDTRDADRYHPSHNVPPGSYLPVVQRGDDSSSQGAVVQTMKWGLIPKFTKKNEKLDHYKMFNARSESVRQKPSFRHLVPNNRCLVAAEGFYEWKKDGSKKQPYYIHFKDDRPLVFAALYDSWEGLEGATVHSFTILTTSASSSLRWLHDRMPVIFGDKASVDAWLNDSSKVDMLMKPYDEPDLGWYPVTPAMGCPSFNGPECIKEVGLKTEIKAPIKNFFSKAANQHGPPASQGKEAVKKTVTVKLYDQKNPKQEPQRKGEDDDDIVGVDEKDEKACSKRKYEEFSADSKLTNAESNKPENTGDRKATLFSYFGKA